MTYPDEETVFFVTVNSHTYKTTRRRDKFILLGDLKQELEETTTH